jgi:integrase
MNVIQAQLGHSNLGTRSRYLAHIAPAGVIRVMQGGEWEA